MIKLIQEKENAWITKEIACKRRLKLVKRALRDFDVDV